MDLETFTFVLLRRGPRAFDYTEDELEEIQRDPAIHAGRMAVEIMTWLTPKGAVA